MEVVETAILIIRRRRSVKAIETYEQVRFLVEFVEFLRRMAVPPPGVTMVEGANDVQEDERETTEELMEWETLLNGMGEEVRSEKTVEPVESESALGGVGEGMNPSDAEKPVEWDR